MKGDSDDFRKNPWCQTRAKAEKGLYEKRLYQEKQVEFFAASLSLIH